jgi:hypothetical protein
MRGYGRPFRAANCSSTVLACYAAGNLIGDSICYGTCPCLSGNGDRILVRQGIPGKEDGERRGI